MNTLQCISEDIEPPYMAIAISVRHLIEQVVRKCRAISSKLWVPLQFPKIPPETKLQFKSQLPRGSLVDSTASDKRRYKKKNV